MFCTQTVFALDTQFIILKYNFQQFTSRLNFYAISMSKLQAYHYLMMMPGGGGGADGLPPICIVPLHMTIVTFILQACWDKWCK